MKIITNKEEDAIISNNDNFNVKYRDIINRITMLMSEIKEFKLCGNCEYLNIKSTARFKRCSIIGLRDAESIACSEWKLREDNEWRVGQ